MQLKLNRLYRCVRKAMEIRKCHQFPVLHTDTELRIRSKLHIEDSYNYRYTILFNLPVSAELYEKGGQDDI